MERHMREIEEKRDPFCIAHLLMLLRGFFGVFGHLLTCACLLGLGASVHD